MRTFLATALLASACAANAAVSSPMHTTADPHSYAQPGLFRVEHADLDLSVDFGSRRLIGTAELRVRRMDAGARLLKLDTRDLVIRQVTLVDGERNPVLYHVLEDRDAILGSALRIALPKIMPADVSRPVTVRIAYETQPQASGLQWLPPELTAGKRQPFVFTQSQAIHARSWIPLQDTPQVRMTFNARIRVPEGLSAVMGAARRESRLPPAPKR